MRRIALTVLLLLVAGCAGKEGPTGPQGSQGPAGPPGPGTSTIITVLVNASGTASANLPAAAGNVPTRPPTVTCYLSSNPSGGVWLKVSDGYSSTSSYCGIVLSTSGVWTAQMLQAPVGWTAAFVVVY